MSLARQRLLLATWVCAASASVTSCILDFDGLSGGAAVIDDAGKSDAKSDVSVDGSPDAGDDASSDAGDASDAGCTTALCQLCQNTCDGGACEPKVLSAFNGASASPFTIAVGGDELYAVDPNGKLVVRVRDGSDDPVFSAALTNPPRVLGASSTALAWFNDSEGLFGCTLPNCGATQGQIVPSLSAQSVYEIVFDDDMLFWIPGQGFNDANVQACDPTGCPNPKLIAAHQDKPNGITLDTEYVYWSVPGTTNGTGVIRRAPKLGTDAGSDAGAPDYVTGLDSPGALAISNGALYFTRDAFDGAVFACSLGTTSCDSVTKVSPQAQPVTPLQNPRSLVADATHVYFTNDGASTVMGCPKVGCTIANLVVFSRPGGSQPGGLVQFDRCLFWTERDNNTTRVMTVAKPEP